MAKAFVLMTAMPPTAGHLALIRFARLIGDDGVEVIVSTQPGEPYAYERVAALTEATRCIGQVTVRHMHEIVEQNPDAPGFWEMWRGFMTGFGVTKDDYIVASEPYGKTVAALTGSQFFPYDVGRTLNPAKATRVRDDPYGRFGDILPEFRKHLKTRVTVFGAESTGKTTLSRALGDRLDADVLFEYARPYLELTTNEITPRSMTAIWKGQKALQQNADNLDKPYIIQDTDLFSTVGYWQFPHWQRILGACPQGLIDDALASKSDLYIVTRSNIPFEPDPLRYGGDVREGSDEYWIGVCERYDLPYVVLESADADVRLDEAVRSIEEASKGKQHSLTYDRRGY